MHIVIFVTAKDKEEAKRIAKGLLQKKLAACVNIVGKVDSFFWWEGKIDSTQESLMIIKSRRGKLAGIIKTVKALHSYKVPEIIALPLIAGEKKYLEWINESLIPAKEKR